MRIAYTLQPGEVLFEAIRAQGAGGQNVNKVSNAVHLRFDIGASGLPAELKERLRALRDQRISAAGVVVIKAQQFRSLEKNRAQALARLVALIERAAEVEALRRPTAPSGAARRERIEDKLRRGQIKAARRRIHDGSS